MAAASRKKYLTILLTLLCVVILGAAYFFVYIPKNEKQLKAQRHLSLQNVDKNIHEKVANSQALLANLLKDGTPVAYINHLSRSSVEAFSIAYVVKNLKGRQVTVTEPAIRLAQVIDSTLETVVDDSARQVRLLLQKTSVAGGDTLHHRLIMRFSLAQFFTKLLPRNVFEEYVVFVNREPVYTTAQAGVSNLKDTLFGKGSGALPDKDYSLAGVDYKLFSHPVRPLSKKEIVVAGLVSDTRYQQERKKLPFEVVLFLLTALVGIVIALPWLKLFLMGNKDRLRTTDAVASVIVSMLLMSLLFFGFFKYNLGFRPSNGEDPKLVLAKEINTSFQQELNSVYSQLQSVNKAVEQGQLPFGDYSFKSSDSLGLAIPESWKANRDTAIRQVLWLDSSGAEIANWTWDAMNAPHGNFGHRAYFRQLIQAHPWQLNGDPAKPFYLDQVVSWTDGRFTSVMSIPSTAEGAAIGRAKVAAISVRLRSLYKPLLTPGYQFALVDDGGRVLYHSDESRNLNEDLLNELSASNRLKSALGARVKDAFESSYFGQQYTVAVLPVEHLPYSVIVFSDLVYRETREMAIYSFTFSLFIILCLLFVLQLFAVFVVSARRSFFKKQTFDTSWVAPKQASHIQYNLAILANIFIIGLAICFFKSATFLTYVFILLFSVNFVSFFLSALFAAEYSERKIEEYARFKKITLSCLLALAVLLNIIALATLDGENLLKFAVYQAIAIAIGTALFLFRKQIEKWGNDYIAKKLRKRWTFNNSFALMTLTRLILTSALPVAFFYISAYNYEQNISVRYRQTQFGEQLLNRASAPQQAGLQANSFQHPGVYPDSMWIRRIATTATAPGPERSAEDKLTSSILDFFRFNLTDAAVDEDRFSASYIPARNFQFNPLLKDACKEDSTTITYLKAPGQANWLLLQSAKLNYQIPSVFTGNGLAFWLFVFAALALFYFILNTILTKLFCLRLPNLTGSEALDKEIISNQQTNGLLFMIGLPGSGKLETIKSYVKQGAILQNDKQLIIDDPDPSLNTVAIANMFSIPDSGTENERMIAWSGEWKRLLNKRFGLVIVQHFEYNIQDDITNRIKLNFLESLMIANTAKVVILSTIHPVAFLDSVSEQSASTDKTIPGEDLQRWHVLFGHFRIVILPLQQDKAANPSGAFYHLYKETEYTHFLSKLQSGAIDVAKGKEGTSKPETLRSDELIYKLQMSSHYFYMYIWQSLTKEEKFLLYDLAEDDLVNPFDDYNLNMLLAKGVIRRRNGTLTLFNRGFRNFILTAIGNREAAKIRSRIEDNGRWGNLRTPLLIIIAAILGFLLASEEEAYSRLLTYIAALGAGIPAVLKLLSLFDKRLEKN